MIDKRGPQESQSLLELRSGREGDTHTLYLGGELDAASAAALGHELDWIELGDAKAQVLDLSALTFIDSAGLSLLVRASSDFGRDERSLRVVGARGQVRAVLERTGVSESLDLGD